MFAIGDTEWPGISKLVEECGEVQQVCGKLMGSRGDPNHFDGTNLRDRLQDELADLHAAMWFVTHHNQLDTYDRTMQKLALFNQWHRTASDPSLSQLEHEISYLVLDAAKRFFPDQPDSLKTWFQNLHPQTKGRSA